MALIADVFDVTLIDEATGDVIATTTLQEANIDVSVSENEVRAGKGNVLLASLKVSRDITISLTDAEFKYDWLAKQLGQDVKTGAGIAYATPKWYKVTESSEGELSITLDKQPTDVNSLAIYDTESRKIDSVNYTVSGSVVTFTTGVKDGADVEVRTFKYASPPETQTIEFDSKVFAKGVKAILETVEIDSDENITHVLQYQFDSAVPDGTFTINTQSERNAATQSFNLKVIKPKRSNVVGRLLRFPYNAA
ncbi:hypothetical protein NST17_19810 [Caldifermentibacillus hisashii]|uniref:Major tail protein n=1 Tax=Caldifermentibacillus hisashii TaxID=996558 RepID=A0ABU9K522_9BACI